LLPIVLYRTFLISCSTAAGLGLLLIWRVIEASQLLAQVLGSCALVAVVAALTLSATRLVSGPPPEDDRGRP
jgi:hypothetical protein